MFRFAHSLIRISNSTFHPRTTSPLPPLLRTSWRGVRPYPLDPPVEIEDFEAEDYDVITIAGEKFKRRIKPWGWLCLPPVKKEEELIAKALAYNLEWRVLVLFTEPPVYPGMKFYRKWFDLMISADMHKEVLHFYTLMFEGQLDIIFDDELKIKIDKYLEDADARSYHNWEYW